LDLEEQRRVGRDDAAIAAGAIGQIGRDQQRALAAHLHVGDAFITALDDLALAELEFERLAALVGTVEGAARLPVLPDPAGVMHGHHFAGLGLVAGAHHDVAHAHARRGLTEVDRLLLAAETDCTKYGRQNTHAPRIPRKFARGQRFIHRPAAANRATRLPPAGSHIPGLAPDSPRPDHSRSG